MRATVALLLSAEERLKIHKRLQVIDAALTRLERAPGRARLQNRALKKLGSLASQLAKFEASLTSIQRNCILELKALHFFSASFLAETFERVESFPSAVGIVRRNFEAFTRERARLLLALRVLQARFDAEQGYPKLSAVAMVY